jgi:hypothetical protein
MAAIMTGATLLPGGASRSPGAGPGPACGARSASACGLKPAAHGLKPVPRFPRMPQPRLRRGVRRAARAAGQHASSPRQPARTPALQDGRGSALQAGGRLALQALRSVAALSRRLRPRWERRDPRGLTLMLAAAPAAHQAAPSAPVVSAIVYGAAAVLLIAGVFAGAQWLLAKIYGERLDGSDDPAPVQEPTTPAKR